MLVWASTADATVIEDQLPIINLGPLPECGGASITNPVDLSLKSRRETRIKPDESGFRPSFHYASGQCGSSANAVNLSLFGMLSLCHSSLSRATATTATGSIVVLLPTAKGKVIVYRCCWYVISESSCLWFVALDSNSWIVVSEPSNCWCVVIIASDSWSVEPLVESCLVFNSWTSRFAGTVNCRCCWIFFSSNSVIFASWATKCFWNAWRSSLSSRIIFVSRANRVSSSLVESLNSLVG